MFQRVTLIGRVGQDPQMRYTPDGVAVTSFSLATTETISKTTFDGRDRTCPQGWKESYNAKNWELTTWWRVTCWRKMAETINQYLSKGQQVFVEGVVSGEAADGSQNPRVWTGNDGVARASFELTAREVKFLGSRGDAAAGPPMGEPPPETGLEEDTLPF
ncbi:MAG: single-stranded DNA-binding protein [Anaerolineae bacterium]|nr:single-stranded DNA-binding protein [Anaerolineae bacterium]